MKNSKVMWFIVGLLLFSTACSRASTAQANPPLFAGWRTECIGKLLADLPANVVVEAGIYNRSRQYPLADDRTRTPEEYAAYIEAKKKITAKNYKERTKAAKERGNLAMWVADAEGDRPFPIAESGIYAWGTTYIDAYLYRGNRVYAIGGPAKPQEDGEPTIFEKLKAFSPRETFEIPKDAAGLCVPYAFTSLEYDGGPIEYRLQFPDHPDLSVHVEVGADSKYCDPSPTAEIEKGIDKSTEKNLSEYWTRYYDPGKSRAAKVKRMTLQRFPSVQLGGHQGYYTFVEITREDKSIDYGYLAVSQCSSLFALRNKAFATAKGKKPISKDAFKKFVDQVAASIRRRE